MKRSDRFREHAVAAGLALACFCTHLIFLIRYGEMFFWGSDLVANAAYGVTLFSGVLNAGWTVPKPAEMLLFGAIHRMTGDLWFIHLALIVVTAVTVWTGCRLILRHYGSTLGCVAFGVLMAVLPRTFRATLAGGAGVLAAMFLLLAILCLGGAGRRRERILAVVFLSMANLARPDCWPCTYLIIFLVMLFKARARGGPGWTGADLWFLVPMGMPLVWVGVGAAFFGDPLYSINIARSFAAEAFADGVSTAEGSPSKVAGFLPRVQSSLFDLFSLGDRFSVRAVVLVLLFLAGSTAMLRRDARTSLLIGSPIVGTLLFYFAYALKGSLFRPDYIYAILVCMTLVASRGVGTLAEFLSRRLSGRWRGWARAATAGATLLLLVAGPVREETMGEVLPILKDRAAYARWSRPAVERVVEDIRSSSQTETPIVLGSEWVPPSRIALQLRTGKDMYLVERLAGKQRLGESGVLPDLAGRTVYYCFREPPPQSVGDLLRPMIESAARCEAIYRQQGLLVLKCEHGSASPAR